MEIWKMANGCELSVNDKQLENISTIYNFICKTTDKTGKRWYSFKEIHQGTHSESTGKHIGRHQVASACMLLSLKEIPYLKLRVYKYFKPQENKRHAVRISHQVCVIRRLKSAPILQDEK
jgi:hypothetical protein